MNKIIELKELAGKAKGLDTDVEYNLHMGDVPEDIVDKLAPFFAACSPELVQAMCEVVEAADRAVEEGDNVTHWELPMFLYDLKRKLKALEALG